MPDQILALTVYLLDMAYIPVSRLLQWWLNTSPGFQRSPWLHFGQWFASNWIMSSLHHSSIIVLRRLSSRCASTIHLDAIVMTAFGSTFILSYKTRHNPIGSKPLTKWRSGTSLETGLVLSHHWRRRETGNVWPYRADIQLVQVFDQAFRDNRQPINIQYKYNINIQ